MLLVGSASFYIQLSELVWWWWHLWDRVPKWWQNTWWQRWRWQLSVFQSFSCKTWFWLRRPTVFSFLTSNPSSSISPAQNLLLSLTQRFSFALSLIQLSVPSFPIVVNNPHQVCATLHRLIGFTYITLHCLACVALIWHCFVLHCIAPFPGTIII